MLAPESKTCISNNIRNFPCFFILDVKTRGINLMGNQKNFMTMDLTKTIMDRFLLEKMIPEMVISRSIFKYCIKTYNNFSTKT